MRLIDSNILIYASQPQHVFLRDFIKRADPVVSIVSYIEVLGYHKLTVTHRRYFKQLFVLIPPIPVDYSIAQKAVSLRQQRKMSLGDSIVAATALLGKYELVTRNTDDFIWIADLTVINPFTQSQQSSP